MFDTGGSSGELKDKFGTLPQGDVLKCILALAENSAEARTILLKRIRNAQYNGHTGGNILLLGLEKVYGSFAEAVAALSQLLSVRGTVVPITYEHSVLCATYTNGEVFKSETSVDVGIYEGKVVDHLYLEQPVRAADAALLAIRDADVICIGPGSFYTSVLPNLLPQGVQEALDKSTAPIVYIANLLTEGAGMQGLSVASLTQTLESYVGRAVTAVVANSKLPGEETLEKYAAERKYPIIPTESDSGDARLIAAPLWTDQTIARHDTERLSHLLSALVFQLRIGLAR
jgi:uncharacterized cofD-like protein